MPQCSSTGLRGYHGAHPSQKQPDRAHTGDGADECQKLRAQSWRQLMKRKRRLGPKRRVACRGFPLDSDQDKSNGVKGFRICKLLKERLILKPECDIY